MAGFRAQRSATTKRGENGFKIIMMRGKRRGPTSFLQSADGFFDAAPIDLTQLDRSGGADGAIRPSRCHYGLQVGGNSVVICGQAPCSS